MLVLSFRGAGLDVYKTFTKISKDIGFQSSSKCINLKLTCCDFTVMIEQVWFVKVFAILQLIFVRNVIPSLILFVFATLPFPVNSTTGLCTGVLAPPMRYSLRQWVWARPPSGTAGWFCWSQRRWGWGRRYWRGWRRGCCKAPKVESRLISSPSSSP